MTRDAVALRCQISSYYTDLLRLARTEQRQ